MLKYRELFIISCSNERSYMSDVPSTPADTPGLTHVVTVDGCYGNVAWSVGSHLYSIMPRTKRDGLLDLTGQRVIGPFFVSTSDRLLAQVGCTLASSQLDVEWSFETIEVSCEHIGQVIWSIGQGMWDALPADQRTSLLEYIKEIIMLFFQMMSTDHSLPTRQGG